MPRKLFGNLRIFCGKTHKNPHPVFLRNTNQYRRLKDAIIAEGAFSRYNDKGFVTRIDNFEVSNGYKKRIKYFFFK